MSLPFRRFGRTNLNIPVLTLGGMRFQQSWNHLDSSEITKNQRNKVENLLTLAHKYGFSHIETAFHYGTSELELGFAINDSYRQSIILQTKIPPNNNIEIFKENLENSFKNLKVTKIDLVAVHGLNNEEHLFQSIKEGGCVDVLREYQKQGLIGHIGFSTHGKLSIIKKAILSNKFDYVNLHWYFINQNNISAINLAKKYDVGVFIISPTDKGGHLHTPSAKLIELCKPLHPIVFNDLFCLRNKDVHTISVGIAKESDFDHHLEAVSLLSNANEYVYKIEGRLFKESIECLGNEWYFNWDKNLPKWDETPGEINIPVLIWLSNLIDAWDMRDFAKARYQLLGNGSHWFPGNNANSLDKDITADELLELLRNHINAEKVIEKLRFLKNSFGDNTIHRLTTT
tara:strand:- start:832 stop:2031 length:1200 start_codon:yes stop_codon:yes gene_type:complete